jgi:hypothetical protein
LKIGPHNSASDENQKYIEKCSRGTPIPFFDKYDCWNYAAYICRVIATVAICFGLLLPPWQSRRFCLLALLCFTLAFGCLWLADFLVSHAFSL